MRLKVEVTAEDIAKGERQSTTRCPVACAIRRLGHKFAWFNGYDIGDVGESQIRAPKVAQDFAADFDLGTTNLQPFSFELTDEDGP